MMTTTFRRVALSVALGAVATVTWPPAASGVPAQVVRADDALVAHASTSDIPFADGTERVLSVSLVVPKGATTGTAPTGLVDLARPWAVVTETSLSTGRDVCSSVANPEDWNEGSLAADSITWVGAWVDVRCDDGNGYLFYRVHWEPGPYWLVTNPVVTTLMGGQVSLWSAGGMRGSVQLRPKANSPAVVTVCGHRADDGVDCFAHRSGYGAVIVSSDGMEAQAIAFP